MLAFDHGCSYRKRLEDWFAQAEELPERIIEMSSYHAMLGCAVAGMGITLMPRMVLAASPQARYLSIHALPADISRAPTSLIWRKGALSPKVRALSDILLESAETSQRLRNVRKKIA